MKKILLASVITALALPVIASETTTITTSSPKAMSTSTTTTTTVQEQKMEEAPAQAETAAPTATDESAPLAAPESSFQGAPSRAPDANATLPRTGAGKSGSGSFNQQRMEDPSVEDESDEYVPKIDDIDDSEDYE